MPRVDTIRPMAANPPPRRTARNRKPPPPQDRLTQRTLFFRRVRKSLKPGLWLLGLGAILVVGSELVRTLPADLPAKPSFVAPKPRLGFGLAGLLADMGLRIHTVQVNGAVTTDPAQLAAAIGVKPGDATMGFSLTALQARVAQLGPVQSVTVERLLPGTLVVNVTERDALAIWQTTSNGQPSFVLIDKKGGIIAGQDAAEAKRREPALLLLSGPDAPQFADVLMSELQAAPLVLAHVAAAQRVDGLRWNLILKDRTVVKLPSNDEAGAIGQLAALQHSMQLLDRPVEDIDLRQPDRLVIRPYAPPAPPPETKTEPNHE